MGPIPRNRSARTGLELPVLGFGAAPLGNLYQPVSDEEAKAALQAGIDAGLGYVDTAPHYGHGLSERRVGDGLRSQKDIVLSTKVGRILRPYPELAGRMDERHGFCSPLPFEQHYDYSHDGIMRSYEDSLTRLGLARADILFIHDIGRRTHGDANGQFMEQLVAGGGLKALEALRRAGAIAGFGLGVNEWEICLDVMALADLDFILLAGRYSLLEQTALDAFLPSCVARGTAVVIGGAYNSGILATGVRSGRPAHYDYGVAPPAVVERVRALEEVCDAFEIPLAAAALQFPLAHPAVASVVLGLGKASRVRQTVDLYNTQIPQAFWASLVERGLLRADAPTPAGR